MAAGDTHIFDEHLLQVANEQHDLNASDTIKVALIHTTTPAETDADPHFGGTGTTDLSTNEVTAGGNYTAGGATAAATYAETGGTVTFDIADVSWLQHASNPTNARWAIIYNDSDTRKGCIGYIDLGATIDMSAGDLTITIASTGIYTSTTTAGT